MYKVLFVDDEILTRQAISRNTPWEEAGFTLVGAAENGKQAIEMVEEFLPDLVLTDICMPIMDGIGLASYIHENHPEIKVVILSGYDDFEYAKSALKYEVIDYILKPITSFELKEELDKIRKKLDASMEKQVQVEKIKQEYEKNMPTLRSHFLNRLLEGSYLKKDVQSQMEHLGLVLQGNYQAVVAIDLEDASEFLKLYPDAKEDLIDFSIGNITGEIVEDEHDILFFQNTENQSICIFQADKPERVKERVELVGQKIIDAMERYMKLKVSIMVGKTVTKPEEWGQSYVSVNRARDNKFLLEDHAFVYGEDFAMPKVHTPIQASGWVEKLVLMIKLNQLEELKETVEEMFREFRASGCEKKTILLHVQNVVLTILIELEDCTSDISQEQEEVQFIHHLSNYKHLSEVEGKFLDLCKKLSMDIAGRRESVNQKQAILAMDYIDKNYMNVNMSLNMVCAHLCVSTSYFSTIFKNATGETFVEALTRVRMEKAKNLLETTNMKSYEVALTVGYNDPHYFSSIFKKHMGMTPTEYVKQLKQGSGK